MSDNIIKTSTDIYDAKNWHNNAELAAKYLPEPFKNKPENIKSVEVEDMSGTGGNSGEMNRIVVTAKDGVVTGTAAAKGSASTSSSSSSSSSSSRRYSFVLKTTRPAAGSGDMSKSLGLYREAIFYKKCIGTLFDAAVVPEVYCSEWNLETGRKCMLMEDLTTKKAVQAGYFFGDVSFNNFGKDLKQLTADYPTLTELEVCKMAFSIAAKLHGGSWGCSGKVKGIDLLSEEYSFLKGQLWLIGQDKSGWENSKNYAAAQWQATLAAKTVIHDENSLGGDDPGTIFYKNVNYSHAVLDFMQSTLIDATFEGYVSSVKASNVIPALTHGDFHPGNFMVISKEGGGVELKVLDFEVMGIGSGPQDLGQFLVSHSSPEERRKNEEVLLRQYHKELCECITATSEASNNLSAPVLPTFDYIMTEYVVGGLGRWAWLLGVCSAVCPAPMNQIFNTQLTAFIEDHKETLKGVKVFPRP